jgi:hypothetical protein
MRSPGGQPKYDTTEDVGVEGLLSVALLEGLAPICGRQLEHPMEWPSRQEAEEVAHVAERLNLVQAAAREERDEGGVDLAAVVAADEEPILPTHDFAAEVQLAHVVVQGQPAIVQEASKCGLLVGA